ncbi:MAG: hypothetical protein ABIN80_18475 [Dyadobacter sp.]
MNPTLKRFLVVFFVLIGVLLAACQNEEDRNKEEKFYFDLKSFIENQIVYLNDKRPIVTKIVGLDRKTVSNKSKDIDWKKELELFVQADLNKPSYRSSYIVERKDSATYEYTLKANVELPVRYLKIVTDTNLHQPIYVKARFQSVNKIYKSEKTIELACSKKNNLLELTSYAVNGYQKLIFMDRKAFDIKANIGF